MKEHYEQAFIELLNIVKARKEIILKNHELIKKSMGSLFSLGDEQFSEYAIMVESNEYAASKAIEAIAVSLFTERKYKNFKLYPVDSKYQKCSLEVQAKSRPFQIILTEKDIKIGVIFTPFSDGGKYYKQYEKGDDLVDLIQLVILAEPDDSTYNDLFVETNEFNKKAGISIQRITVQQFWEKHFGSDEYKILKTYVNDFNSKAVEIIGFQTVLSPTEEAIEHFRNKIGKEIVMYPYRDNIPDDIYSKQIDILYNNYIGRGLWRAMVGKSSFAVSFITSEWYYKVYQLSENLDLTSVVAGYLKSIEQLLFTLIGLAKGTGITILSKEKYNRENRIILFTEENEDLVDTTLGALEQVIAHNGQMLDVNRYAREYIVKTIDEWRDKQRNGYFHKHNLQSVEKVSEIREKAFQLYFLLLGSCTIQDEQLEELGLV